MKMRRLLLKAAPLLVITLLFVGAIVYAVAMQQWTSTKPVTYDIPTSDPTPPPLPSFLALVKPTGIISMVDYEESLKSSDIGNRGIVLGVVSEDTEMSTQGTDIRSVLSKITLYVDKRRLTNLTVRGQDGLMPFGPFILSWSPRLEPGVHEVKVQFHDSGSTMEYVWEFVLTASP
jgi:hypothetical protein